VNVLVHYALYLISSITKGDVVAGDQKRLAVAWEKYTACLFHWKLDSRKHVICIRAYSNRKGTYV